MPFNFKYVPIMRSRQQELIVLKAFDFEDRMYPMLEIIKEKDRVNNNRPVNEIWLDCIQSIPAQRVFVDLPVYIKDTTSMSSEVVSFNRTLLSNLDRRLAFFQMFAGLSAKVIPVISTLFYKTKESNSITNQIKALRQYFPNIAIRTFTSTFENDLPEIKNNLSSNDVLFYDLDTIQPLNPLVRKQRSALDYITVPYKVAIRSAINTEIQNIKLDHGEVVADADNSLMDLFVSQLHVNAFGDYAGIKKDDLNSGGTISPGFIFYDPIDDLYYGYKGEIKSLNEFGVTIVPDVLNSPIVQRMKQYAANYVSDENLGYRTLLSIQQNPDSGRSQAKFKRIAMEHYLHCIREKIRAGVFNQP
jgi:hypothetical protein